MAAPTAEQTHLQHLLALWDEKNRINVAINDARKAGDQKVAEAEGMTARLTAQQASGVKEDPEDPAPRQLMKLSMDIMQDGLAIQRLQFDLRDVEARLDKAVGESRAVLENGTA